MTLSMLMLEMGSEVSFQTTIAICFKRRVKSSNPPTHLPKKKKAFPLLSVANKLSVARLTAKLLSH